MYLMLRVEGGDVGLTRAMTLQRGSQAATAARPGPDGGGPLMSLPGPMEQDPALDKIAMCVTRQSPDLQYTLP